jgi:hypothetical protein
MYVCQTPAISVWGRGRSCEFSLGDLIGWRHGKESSQGISEASNEKKKVGIKQNQPRKGEKDATNGPTKMKNLAVTVADISDS